MTAFNRHAHGTVVADLLREDRLPPLGPGTPNAAAHSALEAFRVDIAFAPKRIVDHDMAACCHAALWLHHDFLDESHTISQGIHTPTGSYWHAIMHRREPDASNAAYWFRRVGTHSIFEPLAAQAAALGLRLSSSSWDPFEFIDRCERQRGTGSDEELLLRKVQLREWETLFDWCAARAVEMA